jgi:hypothetical protein
MIIEKVPLFLELVDNRVSNKTKYVRKSQFNGKGCNVVLWKSRLYTSLHKILKFIAQNLQHGSISGNYHTDGNHRRSRY